MAPGSNSSVWAVVLAGGDGRRLASLTSALYGRPLPKQFAVISGERSLLQTTLDRIAPLVPTKRTMVVVNFEYADLAQSQLADYPDVDVIAQPRNIDTGPGVLLPLALIRRVDPSARVVIFPSDHHVEHEEPFLEAASNALEASRQSGERLALVGVTPDRAETDYGWIVPEVDAAAPFGARSVVRFVEKPPVEVANQLISEGALWNTFVSAGSVRTFWDLARFHLPHQAERLEAFAQSPSLACLERTYANLEPANFSSDLLEQTDRLVVVECNGSGWSDWGSPDRVLRSLSGKPESAHLLRKSLNATWAHSSHTSA